MTTNSATNAKSFESPLITTRLPQPKGRLHQPASSRSEPIVYALSSSLPQIVLDFSMGVPDSQPTLETISMAGRLVRASQANVNDPDIVLDCEDGELVFNFSLPDGRFLMAEFTTGGTLWVGVYGEGSDTDIDQIELMMPATEEQFLGLYRR